MLAEVNAVSHGFRVAMGQCETQYVATMISGMSFPPPLSNCLIACFSGSTLVYAGSDSAQAQHTIKHCLASSPHANSRLACLACEARLEACSGRVGCARGQCLLCMQRA